MSSLIRVVLDISKNGQCLYYRKVLFQFDMTHKTKLKCRSGDTVNPELVISRELVFANCREDVTVEKVLSFPIGPIPTVLNLFVFIDCNKGMSSLIRVVLDISKNGQCLYYRKVLFQLMYKICLTGFAHCAIVVKQLCWNWTNWKRQNLFNSKVLSTICKNQFPTKN
jgi:hypothetical protein